MAVRRMRNHGQSSQPDKSHNRWSPAGVLAVVGLAVAVTVGLVLFSYRASPAVAAKRASRPVAASAVPPANALPTYTGAVTNGAAGNDLYEFFAAHADQVVSLKVTITKPVAVDLTHPQKKIRLTSGCGGPAAPASCARLLNLAGVQYVVLDAGGNHGLNVSGSGGTYQVQGTVMVAPVTMDATGVYTVTLRAVSVDAPVFDGDPQD